MVVVNSTLEITIDRTITVSVYHKEGGNFFDQNAFLIGNLNKKYKKNEKNTFDQCMNGLLHILLEMKNSHAKEIVSQLLISHQN